MSGQSTQSTHALIQEFMAARNDRDRDRIAALMTDDVEYVVPRSHDIEPFHGAAAVEALSGALTGRVFDLSTIQREVKRITVEGNVAAVEQTMSGTTLDGQDYTNDYVWIYELRDGKIARLVEYMDTFTLAKVMGKA